MSCPVDHSKFTTEGGNSHHNGEIPFNHPPMTGGVCPVISDAATQHFIEQAKAQKAADIANTTSTDAPKVCPIDHSKFVQPTTNVTTGIESKVCPIDHSQYTKKDIDTSKVCPINHTSHNTNIPVDTSVSNSSTVDTTNNTGVCPVNHGSTIRFLEGAPEFPPARPSGEHTGIDAVGDVFPDSKPIYGQRMNLNQVPSRSNIPKSERSRGPPSLPNDPNLPQVPQELKDVAAIVQDKLACTSDEAGPVMLPGKDFKEDTWTFPSQQRFYNAMKKKGWNPNEIDIPYILSVHNTINQQAWQRVMQYEKYHMKQCLEPKLLKFQGRPQDLSPKAQIMNKFGWSLPFDRHDWTVDRCGTDVRYIIDFYDGPQHPSLPVSTFLDVRPALDSPTAFIDRARRWVDERFEMKQL